MAKLPPYRCVYYLQPTRPGTVPTRVEPQPSREAALGAARARLPRDVLRVDVERAVFVRGDARHARYLLQARRYRGRQGLLEIKPV